MQMHKTIAWVLMEHLNVSMSFSIIDVIDMFPCDVRSPYSVTHLTHLRLHVTYIYVFETARNYILQS